MLYLQADHLFYERVGSEEACIEVITRHVQRVNNIYKVTGELLLLKKILDIYSMSKKFKKNNKILQSSL